MDQHSHRERINGKRDFREVTRQFLEDPEIKREIFEKLTILRENAEEKWKRYEIAKEHAEEDHVEYKHAARELQTKSLSEAGINKEEWNNMLKKKT